MDHHYHLQLRIVCIFIITCKIVHGQYFGDFGFGFDDYGFDDNYNIYQNPPKGYHYETITEVLQNYDPTTYSIMPMSSTMLTNGRGKGRGKSKKKAADNDSDADADADADDEENEEGNDENNEDKHERKKRGYFDYLPFMSADKTVEASATATSSTAATSATTSTKKSVTEEVSVNKVNDITKVDEKMTKVDDKMTEVKTDSTNSSMTIGNTMDPNLLSNTGSTVMDIIVIGKNIEESMIVAAPYLPLVWKVATFVVPGLQPFQMLTLSVNVASITMHAAQQYMEGESMTNIAAGAMYETVCVSLSKRDSEATFGNYASNIYDSLKSALSSRFSSRFFSSGGKTPETSSNENSIKTLGNENNVNTVKTTVTKTYVNGVEMPGKTSETQKIVINTNKNGAQSQITPNESKPDESSSEETKETENIKKDKLVHKTVTIKQKIINMKDHKNSDENLSNVSENSSNKTDSDESIEVDETRFKELLDESMKLQPEFIQKKSGKDLVKYLNRLKIDLPSPRIDTKQTFESLTDMMDFDEDVTEEQINKLNDVLSKATDYFIFKALQNKPTNLTVEKTN